MLNVLLNAPTLRVYTHYKRKKTQTDSERLRLPIDKLVPVTSYSTITGLLGDTTQLIPIAIIGNTSAGEGYRYSCPTAAELYKANDTLSPGECHFASITRENSPCHLYFDFDCKPNESTYINQNGGIPQLQAEFMLLLTQAFVSTFNRPPVLARDKRSGVQWENASTDDRISLHLHIVSEAFLNVNQYRQWVQCVLLPVIHENGVLLKAGRTDRSGSTVMDGSVYTKNRAFRLLGSCKPGKCTLQYLPPSNEDTLTRVGIDPILLSLMGLTSYIIDLPRDMLTGAILDTYLLTFESSVPNKAIVVSTSTIYPRPVCKPCDNPVETTRIDWPSGVYTCLGISASIVLYDHDRSHTNQAVQSPLFSCTPPSSRLEWATTHAKLLDACRPYLPPAPTQNTTYTLRTFLETKGAEKTQANCTSFAGRPIGGCFSLQEADWPALLALSITSPDGSNHIQQQLQLKAGRPPLRPLMFDLDLTGPSYLDITRANLPTLPELGNPPAHTRTYNSILEILCAHVSKLTLAGSRGICGVGEYNSLDKRDQRAFVASACGPTKMSMVKSSYHIVFPALLVTHEQVAMIRASLVATIRSRVSNLNKCQFDQTKDQLDVDDFIDKMIDRPTHGSRMLYQTKQNDASGSRVMYPLTVVNMQGQEDITNVGWLQFSTAMNILHSASITYKPVKLCIVPQSCSTAGGDPAAWATWFNRIVFNPSLPLHQPSPLFYRDVRAATDKEQYIIINDILALHLGSSVAVKNIVMSQSITNNNRSGTVTHARGVTKRNTAMCVFRVGHTHHSNRMSFTVSLRGTGWLTLYCFKCRKTSNHINISTQTMGALSKASKQ
jgi:hypothetical protein